MAQEFSHPARSQMPEITSPNAFGMKAFHKLAKDSFNAVAHVSEKTWIRLFLVFGRSIGSEEVKPITLPAMRQVWVPVIAICQDIASDTLQQIFCAFDVGQMGRRQGTIHQNPW